jgi:hypothetical protein
MDSDRWLLWLFVACVTACVLALTVGTVGKTLRYQACVEHHSPKECRESLP